MVVLADWLADDGRVPIPSKLKFVALVSVTVVVRVALLVSNQEMVIAIVLLSVRWKEYCSVYVFHWRNRRNYSYCQGQFQARCSRLNGREDQNPRRSYAP